MFASFVSLPVQSRSRSTRRPCLNFSFHSRRSNHPTRHELFRTNPPTAANPAFAFHILSEHHCRGVANRDCSVKQFATALTVSTALLLAVDGCSRRPDNTYSKGIELYSWYYGTDWHFSLIAGVNNRKPVLEVEEVKQQGFVGMGKLKRELSKLAKGQEVWWLKRGLEPVPAPMEKDLLSYCRGHEINLKPESTQKNALLTDSAVPLGFHPKDPWSQSR